MKLSIKGVGFSYADTPVLENINLEVDGSELLGIVGPNGAGKTTLLKCMNLILRPGAGNILLDGKEIEKIQRQELAKILGYVPQHSPKAFPTTVFDLILLGRRPYVKWGINENDIKKVTEVMKLLKIEDFALRYFDELSGGERQKVLIARALAQEPDILLLDEPTSNLDLKHQLEVMEIIKNLARKGGISVIMAIHDLNLASRYSDRIVMLKDGTICAAGEPNSLLTSESIRSVYGVEAVVVNNLERPYIVPIKSVDRM